MLDVGCGGGVFLRRALASGCSGVGLDHSHDMVRHARSKVGGAAEIVEGKAEALPFPDGAFNAVSCLVAFFFFADAIAVLREMRRVLDPEQGRVAIMTTAPEARGTSAAPYPLATRGHFYTDGEFSGTAAPGRLLRRMDRAPRAVGAAARRENLTTASGDLVNARGGDRRPASGRGGPRTSPVWPAVRNELVVLSGRSGSTLPRRTRVRRRGRRLDSPFSSLSPRTSDYRLRIAVPEAPLRSTKYGLVPEGDGWFVLNARETRWRDYGPLGANCDFEGKRPFKQLGINLNVLDPGEPMSMYHRENNHEGFLVLAGECLLIAEGEERPLKAWDYFHCPGGTEHTIVGAGRGPSVVLAVGARGGRKGIVYRVADTALKHGAGAEHETRKSAEAYARFPPSRRSQYREGSLPDL